MSRARPHLVTVGLACALWLLPGTASAEWFDDYERGVEALAKGRPKRAIPLLEKTIRKRPEPGSNLITYGTNRLKEYYPYLKLAEAHLALGNLDAAEAALERSETKGKEPTDARARLQARWREAVKAEEARRRGSETKTTVRQTQPALQAKTGSLRHALEEASTAGGELPSAEAALAEVERLLAEQAFALEERRQLQDVTSQQHALGYDQAGHDAGKEEAQALRPFEERLRRLEEADRRLPQAKDRAAQYLASIERRERQAAQARQALQDLAKDLTGLPQITRDLEDKERRAKDLAEEEASLRLELGAAERDLARLDERARQRQVKRDRMEKVADEQAIYDELTVAFGKKGLQALIIESALPEIEEEATHLLARMTDNRMHLRLESQTAYRSREGLQETLEINISDELGERSYETFSGGEAFRINLALRIALSRTLARRAGAPLPTLFIDEGFGTQDPIGREKIVEAINAIADDFERIIIITHIDELKEQFPARIEVRKTPEGSTFWMS